METVISHPDSASDAEPVQARGDRNRFPIPIEKDRNDGKNMKSGKPGSGQPVDGLSALVSVDFSGQGFEFAFREVSIANLTALRFPLCNSYVFSNGMASTSRIRPFVSDAPGSPATFPWLAEWSTAQVDV